MVKKKYLLEMDRGNYALALTILDSEIQDADPPDPADLYNFAVCCVRTGNYKKAIQVVEDLITHYLKFIEMDNAYRLMIYSYIQTGEYQTALRITDERLKVNVGDLRLLSFRAHILEKLGRITDSIQIHRNILKIRPDYINSLNSLAFLLCAQEKVSQSDLDEATDCIRKALKQNPDNAAYLDTFGVLLKTKGNKDQAIRAFNKALAISPQASAEILDHLKGLLD